MTNLTASDHTVAINTDIILAPIITAIRAARVADVSSPLPIFVGFSGGLDSTVLLHLLSRAQLPVNLIAVHIHHGLSANACSWLHHCQQICQQWQVPFFAQRVRLKHGGAGIEDAARRARYGVFQSLLNAQSLLLLGHHADDHAETLLYRIARGTGLLGLQGICRERSLALPWRVTGSPMSSIKVDGACAKIIRPLLSLTRDQLHAYACEHQLTWIEDDSNSDQRFDRNYLRAQVLPQLKQRWPQFLHKVRQLSDHATEALALLDEYAREDLLKCQLRQERIGSSLDLRVFSRFNIQRQHHIIRTWLSDMHFSAPSQAQLQQLAHVIAAADDAAPILSWAKTQLRRYRGRLYLLPLLDKDRYFSQQIPLNKAPLLWDGLNPLFLGCGFFLTIKNPSESCQPLHIDVRRGGERAKPVGRHHSQQLKKLLQEYQLEPWLRDWIPLIYCAGHLCAVGDLFYCQGGVEPFFEKDIPRVDWSYNPAFSHETFQL